MTPEAINLLRQFESRLDLATACFYAFQQPKHFAAPQWIIDAFKAGYIVRGLTARGDADIEPVIDSAAIYRREFVLTEKGCELCGLKVQAAKVEPRKVKTLFDLE